MNVIVVKKCCIPYGGENNTPDTGAFYVPDGIGAALIANGSCESTDAVPEQPVDSEVTESELFSLPTMTDELHVVLTEAGITTLEDIMDASDSELTALKLIGPATAEKLKTEAAAFFEQE
jgi:predicted flap endonuclease-1-like 5' DNA nuclease